jgi:hypothetical protein
MNTKANRYLPKQKLPEFTGSQGIPALAVHVQNHLYRLPLLKAHETAHTLMGTDTHIPPASRPYACGQASSHAAT